MVNKITTPPTQNEVIDKVNEIVDGKQDTLVSGTNIKTVNNNSLLGSGNINITANATWGNITGTLSNQTDLNNALSAKAADSDVVKLTGNQTVAGNKTFNNAIKAKAGFDVINGGVTKGTNPASTQYWGLFRANDKNDGTGTWQSTRLGIGEVSVDTNGKTNLMLGVYKNEANSPTNSSINVGYDLTTGAYAKAPNPPASNSTATSDNNIATTCWVNDASKSTNVVHRTGDETIGGTKTFTGIIKGEAASNTNHAIDIGHNAKDYMDFYEYGAVWNFYKSRSNTNTLIAKLTENYLQIPTPTEDTTSSVQADTVGARNTKLASYLPTASQGDILPNFDAMPVLQTIEFNTSDSNWHTICTRNNTETNPKDVVDCVYFRITVTGTNINQVADCAWIMKGQANSNPTLLINYMPGTSDGAYSGFRYIREIYPKALNNGYKWALEVLQNRNNNARHYKIQVFKTNSNYTWTQGTASTYNGTYHNAAQYGAETTSGYFISYLNGTVGQASNAGGLNDRLNKVFNTNFPAGEALRANQFVYMNNNKHYPATDKTKAIEPGYGIQFTNTAYNANADVGWDRIRQKQRVTSLTNIPHATLARGNPCYFRCTMDSNGNILSDNYVATSMANGYTWYYVGVAESSTAITIDTTQSFFITLDSNGKVTHINGKRVAQPTVNNATLTLTQGGTTKGTFTANASSNVTIDLDSGGSSRNVGEIVSSTIPLTDAGLHLLDGGIIQRGSYADFVNYIAGLVSTYPDLFTTEANWQSAVTTYGVCGKFVYNSTNNTVRLPKITGFVEGTTDVTALGDLIEAGLPAHIHQLVSVNEGGNGTGGGTNGFINAASTSSSRVYTNTAVSYAGNIDNPIYGNSDTVQPQSINVLYYIVIATSTKTDIEVDIDEIATDLNGKVDKADLSPIHVVVDTYVNGTDWYRVYDDGWVEQGCHKDNWGDISTYTLLVPMINNNYTIVFNGRKGDSTSNLGITNVTTTLIEYNNQDSSLNGDILICGKGA